ncbi:MAG: hypothetical protein JOZ81_25850 [Chloroflexi bacterium]|nr:hypothetical protein [Chloroflexota bacterium]
MPLRNRVTPFGDIVAVSGRGTLMGNRGVLHNDRREIVRDSQVRRWIACALEFRGRHREVMPPGRWTALFFLDEAAAFAAGHRPCAECRNADYRRFRAAWPGSERSIDEIDARLHAERRSGPWQKRTYSAEMSDLPDGAYIALDGKAWLVHGPQLHAWSPDAYTTVRPRPAGTATVLTPPSIVALFQNGYKPRIHPTIT